MEKNIPFKKQYTQQIKGIAILLMIYHHLFVHPERLHYAYNSFLISDNYNYQMNIAWFSNLCVAIFVFLSGFGLSINEEKKSTNIKLIFNRLEKLFYHYWSVFFLVIPIGFMIRYNFSLIEFLANLFGISSSYCGEWWFIRLYIELIIIFPLIYKINKKKILFLILLFFLSRYLENTIEEYPKILIEFYIKEFLRLINWIPVFFVGVLSAKHNFFSIYQNFFYKYKFNIDICSLLILIILALFRYFVSNNTIIFDFVITPFFIYASVNLVKKINMGKFLEYFGNRSTALWLIHPFFCYYYFQEFTFAPYYSILIYFWLIMISLGITYITDYFYKFLVYVIYKLKNHENIANQ